MKEFKDQAHDFLVAAAKALDISDTQYELATGRLESIAKWFTRDKSILKDFAPVVYPQGSFLLGTVIKPASDAVEYDVDCVCELERGATKSDIPQKVLKDAIGVETKEYAKAQTMKEPPVEGRRCWTLNYADEASFHLDILPAIPDSASFVAVLAEHKIADMDFTDQAIAITDNTHKNYALVSDDWPRSNPKGFAAWFMQQMQVRFAAQREMLAKSENVEAAKIPNFRVKTPLQRAVQILKRHRDIMFVKEPDDKPISIIITTLSAHSYSNEDNLLDALSAITSKMDQHITNKAGVAWIANPVNPLENFADKWVEHPKRKENFYRWLEKVRKDLSTANATGNVQAFAKMLEGGLGAWPVNEGLKSIPKPPDQSLLKRAASLLLPWFPKFMVPHREKPSWPVDLAYDASVSGTVVEGSYKTKIQPDGPRIAKNKSLKFRVDTNTPWPYEVYWQVVNTGQEATDARCLRGGLTRDGEIEQGTHVRKETTLYTGDHCVTCYIVKNGVLVAQSPDFEVKIA
jgi:hypothetical protein